MMKSPQPRTDVLPQNIPKEQTVENVEEKDEPPKSAIMKVNDCHVFAMSLQCPCNVSTMSPQCIHNVSQWAHNVLVMSCNFSIIG